MNILLITSDQQRWDGLGKEMSVLKTPNLDKLADRGILFNKAYTPSPVCTPARVSILTGQYPSRHGCYTIGTSLPEDYPTCAEAMSSAGVFTALLGKAHFQPCTTDPTDYLESFEAPPHIFDFDFFREWSGPYYGFELAKLSIAHSCEKYAGSMHYGQWLKDEMGVELEDYFGNNAYTDFGPWSLPEELHNSRWTADETIEALEQAREDERPFFIWSSFQDPHNPCVTPEPWASMYRPEDMPDYYLREGELDDKPEFYRALQECRPTGDPDIDMDETGKNWYCVRGIEEMTEEKVKELTAVYFGMISLMDHHIGRILNRLEDLGLADNTIVIFTTDHGDYLGNHGFWWKGFPAYDDAQRIPFIVAHPECRTPGRRSDAPQNLVDIFPSAMRACGMDIPPLIQGIDQGEAWKDTSTCLRDWTMVEYRPTEGSFMQKTFVKGDMKLVVYHDRPYGELYDMANDPEQLENLWEKPEMRECRENLLRDMISAEMEKDGQLRTRLTWA
ncbi:MAG: sulfatase-like hydrolase/transferase [Candidatus Sumerlaeota bacterium]